jgi:hypothetical protein
MRRRSTIQQQPQSQFNSSNYESSILGDNDDLLNNTLVVEHEPVEIRRVINMNAGEQQSEIMSINDDNSSISQPN